MQRSTWQPVNILTYGGNTEAELQAIIEKVTQQYVEHGLAGNLHKSEFHVHETIFSGHVINGQEVNIDPSKLKTMSKWPIPMKKKEVHQILVFTTYYRRFIVNYCAKVRPLIDLTQDVSFTCGDTQLQAYNQVRVQFPSASILTQLDRNLETIIDTDASKKGIAGMLFQYHVVNGCKQLYPVEYNAKTLSGT